MYKHGVLIFSMALAPLAFGPLAFGQSAATNSTSKEVKAQDDGVQQAVAFQRLKDREDALQARKEQRNPSRYNYQADRQSDQGGTVKDPGSAQYQRDKIGH